MKIHRLATLIPLLALGLGGPAARAGDAPVAPEFAPLQFLVGEWTGSGKYEGGTTLGTSSIHPIVSGHVLLRRDHTEMTGTDGKAAGGFDQAMMIYMDRGKIHADYLDGQHVIHYVSAETAPGSVSFTTDESAPGPAFRLAYQLGASGILHITFSMRPPGQAAYATVAEGDATRKP